MTQIGTIYADFKLGYVSAKAEVDGHGFFLRLKTATGNYILSFNLWFIVCS